MASTDLCPQGFGESAMRLSQIALQVFNHRRGEVELVRSGQHVALVEFVLHHELGQVSHHFGGRRNLHAIYKRDEEAYIDNRKKKEKKRKRISKVLRESEGKEGKKKARKWMGKRGEGRKDG